MIPHSAMSVQKVYNERRSMEFPDPETKRARTRRLFTWYGLAAIVIAIVSLLLLYAAQGYSYDPNKGLGRDGLLFVDAKPKQATIYLNGKQEAETDARLVLPGGKYDIKLTRDKYRDWHKTIAMEGGTVQYLTYPRLFPVDIATDVMQSFDAAPLWTSQSLDRRWLFVQTKPNSPELTLYDLNRETPTGTVVTLGFALGAPVTPIEWSSDNKHLLVATVIEGKKTYMVLDREQPADSFDLSARLKLGSDVDVVLRNKKPDQYYIRNTTTAALYTATLADGVAPTPLLSDVVAFKSYSADTILYVTYAAVADTTMANVRILNGSSNYLLQPLKRDAANTYLLDTAKFKNDWFFVVAGASSEQTRVYVNPLSRDKPGNTVPIAPQLSLRVQSPRYVSFSENARCIAVQSGSAFGVYDAELKKFHYYTSSLTIPADREATWMDGHRLVVSAGQKASVFEFDGANMQTLVSSYDHMNIMFTKDYSYGYTFVARPENRSILLRSSMVAD